MKKYLSFILFIFLLTPLFLKAAETLIPLENLDNIQCLSPDKLSPFNPTRIGQNQIRYYFAGPKRQWTPMYLDTNQARPFTEIERAAPQIQVLRISLNPSANGDWTISCTYGGVGMTNVINEGVMMLTVRAKTCTLNAAAASVSCKN